MCDKRHRFGAVMIIPAFHRCGFSALCELVCWFSSLLLEVFPMVLQFPLSLKKAFERALKEDLFSDETG